VEPSTGRLSVIYKIVGEGTAHLATLPAGTVLNLLGALGVGFSTPPAGTQPIVVAGGYGCAATYLFARRSPVPPLVLIGGRSAGDILLQREFADLGCEVRISTNDGTQGHAGFVTAQSVPIQPQVKWTLDDRLIGSQEVYVRYRDVSGAISAVASASIVYDPIPPVGLVKVTANNGLVVLVSVEAWDTFSGVTAMAVGLNPDDLLWQSYATVVKLALPAGGQGSSPPVVYARFRDLAGNESPVYRSDTPAAEPKRVFVPLTTIGR